MLNQTQMPMGNQYTPFGGYTRTGFYPMMLEHLSLSFRCKSGIDPWFKAAQSVTKRILIVDDNHMTRRPLQLLLEELGYEIEEADNGAAALALLDGGHSFDLVISDNLMPVMTGMEFIQILAERSYISTHPVILFSGNLTDELKQTALGYGVYAVLPKPYKFDELLRKVAQACEHR